MLPFADELIAPIDDEIIYVSGSGNFYNTVDLGSLVTAIYCQKYWKGLENWQGFCRYRRI